MIFFRGPWVYISPTRIPARCPAKEVLGEKENLHECLLCCGLHTVFSIARGVSVNHSLQALVLHHIFHAEQHLTQSQGHHFLPYMKKKVQWITSKTGLKGNLLPWPREVTWLLQDSRSVFVKTTHYTSSSFMPVALIRKYQWKPFPLNKKLELVSHCEGRLLPVFTADQTATVFPLWLGRQRARENFAEEIEMSTLSRTPHINVDLSVPQPPKNPKM